MVTSSTTRMIGSEDASYINVDADGEYVIAFKENSLDKIILLTLPSSHYHLLPICMKVYYKGVSRSHALITQLFLFFS